MTAGWEYDETRSRGLVLDRLAEELERLADEGETPDRDALARKFGVEPADVDRCQRAVGALGDLFGKPSTPATQELETLGGYELRGELARGGMGAIYRAWHPGLQREVALKVLLAGKGASPKQLERFRIEGRAAARLRHPNIVPVHDIAQDDGYPFLILDLVEGESLATRLEREGPLPPRVAADVGQKLAEALHYAHAQLILHRDLKPGNVLLDANEEPLLTDFGLAKVMDTNESEGLTQSGQVLGTVPFMAPEQASGNLVDRRTDVYGLGATIYALLTGQAPFTGELMLEVLGKVAAEEPPPPSKLRPDIDRDLETIVLTCLEKEPDRRYPTARALGEDLRRWLADEPILARPPTWRDRGAKWIRRNPTAFRALTIGLVLLVLGGTGAAAWVTRARRHERLALVDSVRTDAKKALRQLSWIGEKSDDAPIGRALAALHAAQRWRDLAPDDPAAGAALYRAAFALGDLAREREQWALATQAYELGRGLGDDAQVVKEIQRVGRERAAEAQRRRKAVLAVLDDAESGKLRRERLGLDEGVDTIVSYSDATTIALLCERLEAIAKQAYDLRGALVLGTTPPALQDGLRNALARRWEVPPQHRLRDSETLLREAAERFMKKEREAGERRSFMQVCSSRQRDGLGAKLDAAEVSCRALGRIGRRAPEAIRALGRYLEAESDETRAVPAGLALCRLGGAEAFTIVSWARRRHGATGLFGTRVGRHLSRFKDADLLAGKNASDYLARAEARRELGNLKGARADLDRALAIDAKDPLVWRERGGLRRQAGDLDGALADLDRSVSLAPQAATLYLRGLVHFTKRDAVRARADFERAIALNRNFAPAWAARGQVRLLSKEVDRALADYDEAIRLGPNRPQSYVGRAQARLAQREFGLATSDADRALRLDPGSVGAHVVRGNAALMLGEHVRAAAAFTRALQIRPLQPVALANRALARYRLRDYRGALADLKRLAPLRSKDPSLWVRVGSAHEKLKSWAEAEAAYATAIGLAPADASHLRRRGLVRIQAGKRKEGVADVEAALAKNPQDAVAALILAQVARQGRRFDAARTYAERARRAATSAKTRKDAEAFLRSLPRQE